jgi:hypothetical protein
MIRLMLLTLMSAPAGSMAHAQLHLAGNPNPGVTPPDSGQYAALSVRWWQWAYAQPVSKSPLLDTTGVNANVGQPSQGNIFFLAGLIVVTNGPAPPHLIASADRTITIPTGTRLFFPLLNDEVDNVAVPPTNFTVAQLRQLAIAGQDNPQELHASIDGVPVQNLSAYRVLSPVFGYVLPNFGPSDQNLAQLFGIPFTGPVYPAVGDGYYLLLEPLTPGTHVINFGGTSADGSFSLDITYHITVVPGSK